MAGWFKRRTKEEPEATADKKDGPVIAAVLLTSEPQYLLCHTAMRVIARVGG
jgi:hypothetical protein